MSCYVTKREWAGIPCVQLGVTYRCEVPIRHNILILRDNVRPLKKMWVLMPRDFDSLIKFQESRPVALSILMS